MIPVDDPKLLREQIAQLKNVISEQEETITQLKLMLLPPEWEPPAELRLTKQEARIFAALYKANGAIVDKERLFYALYHDVLDQPEIKIVDVFVCKARRKLAEYGIEIITIHGRGYALDEASLKVLREWGIDPNETTEDQMAA